MNKKFIAFLLAASMTVGALAACGSTPSEEGGAPAPNAGGEESGGADAADEGEDLAEITVSYWTLGQVPDEENITIVEDAINEITEAEINTTVNLNIMDSGTYIPNGAMANGVANGEDFDLVLTAPALSGHYNVMSSNGMLMPLNDLLTEYAPELLETVPADFLGATTKGGDILAVPSYCNKVQNQYWVVRNEVLDGIGLDINTVKTLDDVDKALYQIKEKFPEMNPLSGNSFSINLTYPGYALAAGNDAMTWDAMGEATAVAAAVYYDDETLTAVSRYETDEFKADMDILKKWYKDGILDKDVATDSATSNTLKEKATAASTFYTGQFDLAATLADDTSFVKIGSGGIGTGQLHQFTWALPVSCDEPEAAAKFMNMLFTDSRIIDLVNYGVEGVHYEKKADGTIGFLEGMTSDTCGYYMGGLNKLVGNGFLASVWEGADPESNTIGKEEMDNAVYSPLLGFSIDTQDPAIADIYTAIAPIANQEYGPGLFCGSAPEGAYEEMMQKLNDAGLQTYLDTVNAQIQAWVAENK